MKYFLHDTSASDDEKITELFIEHGYEGIGLFYSILERIGKQEKPIKTIILKTQLKVGKKLEKCWSFMESLGLISSNNGETFNERILSYSKSYEIKKEKTREKIAEWRKNKEDTKNVTGYSAVTKPVSNAPKVKESKVKESKEINTPELVPESASDDFKRFLEFIETNAPTVNKMTEPFTEKQFFDLKKLHPAQKIAEILQDMHNYKPLLRKNKSAFLTAKKWLKPKENGTEINGRLFTGNSEKLGTSAARMQAIKNW